MTAEPRRVLLACLVALPAFAAGRDAPDTEFLEFLGFSEEEGWDEFFDELPPEAAGDGGMPPPDEEASDEQD
ncbi:MAG: hypothetical protein D6727_11360 [Gammaproteobacteria bacterium]|nr:MAG: hypothetical protein D6727_11360 [Gammaproteobacteria bacterium]